MLRALETLADPVPIVPLAPPSAPLANVVRFPNPLACQAGIGAGILKVVPYFP